MSVTAVLALATQCVPPSLAPVMTGIARHESGLDPTVIHYNRNGTLDAGLTQVNSANFGWLGLTLRDALDPCKNLAAGAKVLLARYNGSTGVMGAAYASGAEAAIRLIETTPSSDKLDQHSALNAPAARDGKDQPPPSWDVWGLEVWRRQNAGADKPKEPK